MADDKIIYYDEKFIENFEQLKTLLEEENKKEIHRYLIDHFGYIFKTFQYYAKHSPEGVPEFIEADEETKREFMRPLSFRQYRMIERSYSWFRDEEWLVNWTIWDFLHDNGDIYRKKIMSASEAAGCSQILENVYVSLSRKH